MALNSRKMVRMDALGLIKEALALQQLVIPSAREES